MKKIRGQAVYPPQERITRMVEIDEDTQCWNWKGTTRRGYGRLIAGSRTDGTRKSVSAHRFAYEAFVGSVPNGLEVCHSCDNRACCNPEHLFVGTKQDNMDDRELKGRNAPPNGEKNGAAVLNDAEVLSARRLRSAGHSYAAIAARLGVCKSTIQRAVNGETWKHVIPAAPKKEN